MMIWRFLVVEHVRTVSNKNFPPKNWEATTQVVISRLARLLSKLDLIDRDVIHECSCSIVNADLNQNLIFLFGTVPKPEFGLSLLIRITWIVRFLQLFTVRSRDTNVIFVKQFKFILEQFQILKQLHCEHETPGSLKILFFLNRTFFDKNANFRVIPTVERSLISSLD